MDNLNEALLSNTRLALPPVEEQFKVIAYVDKITGAIDRLAREAEVAMIILQERRSALISAAVTGKIDVRGLAEAPSEAA